MRWEVLVDDAARKYLKRIPKKDTERIDRVLREFCSDPYTGDIEKMKGEENVWRRRIGSYRILYEIIPEKRLVYIVEIKRRTSSTY